MRTAHTVRGRQEELVDVDFLVNCMSRRHESGTEKAGDVRVLVVSPVFSYREEPIIIVFFMMKVPLGFLSV